MQIEVLGQVIILVVTEKILQEQWFECNPSLTLHDWLLFHQIQFSIVESLFPFLSLCTATKAKQKIKFSHYKKDAKKITYGERTYWQ